METVKVAIAGFISNFREVTSKKLAPAARRVWIASVAILFAGVILTVTVVNSMLCLAVYVNGEEVGTVESITDVPKIVSGAEQQLTEILGYDYPLSDSLTVSANIGATQNNIQDIERALITGVSGVQEKYALVIDGKIAGALDDETELLGILDGLLKDFTTRATTSIRFLSEVSIARRYVSEELVCSPVELRAMLSPTGGQSAVTLDIESVEATLLSEEIPFATEYVEDDSIYEGESFVIAPGRTGIVQYTETVLLVNGRVLTRERTNNVQVRSAEPEIVALGTMPLPETASRGYYIWPADGELSSRFGRRSVTVGSSYHKGIDVRGSYGQAIYAADGGLVIFAGWNSSYGYMVKIQHDNGDVTLYAHNSSLLVSEGDLVAQGQDIAKMGSTGISSGVHCHFEVIVNGVQIDPLPLLP